MSQPDDQRPAKLQKRRHVTLASSVHDDTSVFIGQGVREEVEQLSDLLSGIKSTDGLAAISIKPEDFNLWQTASMVPLEPSTAELVSILKVADVLGDTRLSAWVDMFAQHMLATKWQRPDHAEAMLCSLLLLPSGVQRQVISACLAKKPLPELLKDLPVAVRHVAIASAAESGNLEIQLDLKQPEIVVMLLCLTTAEMPGLKRLSIVPHEPDGAAVSPSDAALLVRSVAAHASLTTVDLQKLWMSAHAMRAFGAGLAPGVLPNLVDLHLATLNHPDSAAAVAGLLGSLSALTSFDVEFMARKVGCDAAPDAAVAATSHPQMVLSHFRHAATEPMLLPHLQNLVYKQTSEDRKMPVDDCIVHLLPLLRAPELKVLEYLTHSIGVRTSLPSLRAAIGHLTCLQRLVIDSEVRDNGNNRSPRCFSARALPALRDIEITGLCHVSPLLVAAVAIKDTPALTKLCISDQAQKCETQEGSLLLKKEVPAAWRPLLPLLGRCTALRDLKLRMLFCLHDDDAVLEHSTAFSGALQQLTMLTSLRLQAASSLLYCSDLDGQVFSSALQALTALQEVHLCHIHGGSGTLRIAGPEHVLEACAMHKSLVCMTLCLTGLKAQHVSEMIPKVCAAKRVTVEPDVYRSLGDAKLAELQAHRPGVTLHPCKCETI